MASQTQIDANRRNAAQSTGPKSINGKYIVSKNAIRHGLLSNDGLLMDEDPAEFARFQARWEQDLAPIGEIEKLLARSIIWLAWRMKRAPGVEAGLHLWNRYSESRESIIGWDEQQYRSKVSAATTQTHAAEIESAKKDEGAMPRSVNGLAEGNIERGFSAQAWDLQACIRLERYEARIERRLRKTIVQLQVRQASRRSAISQPINDNAPTRNKKRSNKANCKVQSMTVRNSVPAERRAVPLPRVEV